MTVFLCKGSLCDECVVEVGLDDVVVERVKYVTKLEMVQKMVDQDKKEAFLAGKFHFYRAEGEGDERLLTFMYPQDGQMMGVNVGINVYQDCAGILERNPQMNPEDGFVTIDSDWLASKLA